MLYQGLYESGIEVIPESANVTIIEDEVIHTDEDSGATTRYVELEAEDGERGGGGRGGKGGDGEGRGEEGGGGEVHLHGKGPCNSLPPPCPSLTLTRTVGS